MGIAYCVPTANNNMQLKNKKQFGVWLDSQHATIVGRAEGAETLTVLGHTKNTASKGNSNENAANNQERGDQQKYFKEILQLMQNIDEIHVSGTGKEQEQFIHYMAETPQYKNATATQSTSLKMSDEKLVEYFENAL